jgi:hypothetical protein
MEKAGFETRQVWCMEMSVSEPLMTYRNGQAMSKPGERQALGTSLAVILFPGQAASGI